MNTEDKARTAANVIYTLDRLKVRYEGQPMAAIKMEDVTMTRDLVWSLLERLADKRICEACESHPAFDLDKWLFAESRNKPLAAAAAVNMRKC